jgi:hypothetical protein
MPRRKIIKPSGLPKLTAKQMKFCEGVLGGLSLSDAYRAAYDVQRMGPPQVNCEASRLRAHPAIALWLDAITTEIAGAHVCTREEHLRELARLKAIAIRTGNVGAAVQAEQLRGKVGGHYIEQFADVSDHDPIATLNQIAQQDPELAQRLAILHGITWDQDNASVH